MPTEPAKLNTDYTAADRAVDAYKQATERAFALDIVYLLLVGGGILVCAAAKRRRS